MIGDDRIELENILSQAIKIAGDITILANILGVSTSTIYAWGNGRRSPKRENLDALNAYIHRNTRYTLSKASTVRVADSAYSHIEENIPDHSEVFTLVPLLDIHLRESGKKYAFRKQALQELTNHNEKHVFCYKNVGLQMKPLLSPDAMLLVNAASKSLIHNKIYLISVQNTLYVRRFFISHEQYIFKVENKEFELQNFIFSEDEKEQVTICGEVIWYCSSLL